MSNFYYSPEDFGLTVVGEIEWSDGCYQFDTTVVYRRVADGALLVAEDSGCSCPTPFEDAELMTATVADLQAHLEGRNRNEYQDDRSGAIVNLMARLV